MSYLAQGLNSGFALGAQMKKDRARLRFEEEQARKLDELRQKQLDFEAQRMAEQVRQFDTSFGYKRDRDTTTDAYRAGRDLKGDSQWEAKFAQDVERMAMEKAAQEAARLQRERQLGLQERIYTETQGPGSPGYALPLIQGKAMLENAEANLVRAQNMNTGQPPLPPGLADIINQQTPYKSAEDVRAAYRNGTLPREQAEQILRSKFGLQ